MSFRKRVVDDLALFGGLSQFSQPLHVGCPNIPAPEPFFERMRGVFERRFLSNDGPLVREFEQQIADISGATHAVAVANATLGLEIAARALELRGQVIVPAMTFVASAHALKWQGIEPVFADVDFQTHMLTAGGVRERMTPQTTGIMPVHLWGLTCDIEALVPLASEHSLKILVDGAHSMFATRGGKPMGTFGDATVFSFHATKFVNSFEGGAIVTNDDDVARRCRSMRNFGFTGYDQVDDLGINAKMTEASAAMGLTSLEAAPRFMAVNRRHLEQYQRLLGDLPGLSFIERPANEQDNCQYVVAMVDPARAPIQRDVLIKLLWAENVRIRRYFYPGVHRMAPYRNDPAIAKGYPVTDQICSRILQFPTGTAIQTEEIDDIARLMRFVWSSAEAIHARST